MNIEIDISNFDAVIFDMDGTMINNMPYHQKAWKEFCKRYGLELSEEQFKEKISGKKNNQIFQIVFDKELSDEDIAKFTYEKESLYRELYAPEIKEVDGLVSLIRQLQQKEKKLAIATTAPKDNREFGLRALEIEDHFDEILGDEHVSKGKPDPEIYLETAKRLGGVPSRCLVFEDTPVGIEAAKRAGMKVVGLLTTHSEIDLKNADYLVEHFNQIYLI